MWNQSRNDLQNTARTDSVNHGTGKQLWRVTDLFCDAFSAPVVDINENIYIYGNEATCNYGTLFSLDSSGNIRWSFQSTDANNQPYWSYPNWMIVPVIGPDGTIYYGDGTGDSGTNSKFVFAVNPDGTLKWKYVIPDTYQFYHNIEGTIKLYGNSVYIIDYDHFYVLDATTGALVRTIANPDGDNFNDGFAIYNGFIYVTADYSSVTQNSKIFKIDAGTGNIIWSNPQADRFFSGVSLNDSGLFVMGYSADYNNYAFTKFSLIDGSQQWINYVGIPYFDGYNIYNSINSFIALDTTSVYYSVNSCYQCMGAYGIRDMVDGRIFKYDFNGNPDSNWLDSSGNWITTGYSSVDPVIDGDGFIYTGDSNKIIKINPTDASIIWTYPLTGQYTPNDLAIGSTGVIYLFANYPSYYVDAIASETPNLPTFGDGSDGDVIIATDTILTRHSNFNNLTINDGVRLNTNGFRVRVKNTLTINGIIHNNAGGGGGGWGANYSDPGDCTNCNGMPGTGGLGYGGSGGYGNNDRLECGGDCVGCCANASAGGGGPGGIVTLLTPLALSDLINFGFPYMAGGGGGGGSSNQYCNAVYPCSGPGFMFGGGGPGGNGGGVLIIQAFEIIYGTNGSVQANGNNGIDGITRYGTCCNLGSQYGGGGGGGGGGAQFIVYNNGFDQSRHQVNQGTGGAGHPGQDGQPGYVYTYQVGLLVVVTPNPNSINSGDTSQITINVTNSGSPIDSATVTLSVTDGTIDPLTGLTDTNGNFVSTYTAPIVATVQGVTITATATKTGYTDGLGNAQITVNPTVAPILTTIEISPSTASVQIGDTQQFTAVCKDQNGIDMNCPDITWSVLDPRIGTISTTISNTGLFTGIAVGTTTVTATSDTIQGTADVNVLFTPILTSIDISPTTATVQIGDTQQFTAVCNDQNGNGMTCPDITWSVADPTKGTISNSGIFTGTAEGITNVIATSGTISGSANVTVIFIPILTSINITPSTANVIIGRTQQFAAACKDQNGNDMTCPTLIWSVADPTKGTISQTGLFTGLSQGSTTITAMNGIISGTASVFVIPVAEAGFNTGASMLLGLGLLLGFLISRKKCDRYHTREECEKEGCQWVNGKCINRGK